MEKTMTREFRLGLFIVATLLILGTGVFLIGGRSSWFRGTYCVKATLPNAAGLDPGAEVRVGGVQEGTVVGINLPKHADENVTVEMNLNNATRDVVKKDSVVLIRPEGLQGGETIDSEPPLDFSDLIKKADQILDSAEATAGRCTGNRDQREVHRFEDRSGSKNHGGAHQRQDYLSASRGGRHVAPRGYGSSQAQLPGTRLF
jgi:hypothetical protein